jgi:chromosomal replication initiation ATPase DnaA
LGDERILGDSDFVESVLSEQNERLERRYTLQSQGYDFDKMVRRVGEVFGLKVEEVLAAGKQPKRVEARSLACYWAVREMGMTTVETSCRLGISQSAVTKAVYRGERWAKEKGLQLMAARNE